MKPVSLVLALLLTTVVAGCDDDSPTDPSNDNQFTFAMPLTVAQEVPAPVGDERNGSGAVAITLNVVRDGSGNITSASANFQCALTNFPQTTNFTAAHIHENVVGVSGPIVVNTGLASGEVPLTNGSGSFTKNNINVDPALANRIINNTAGFYFNVHTTLNGPGVVRGQLVMQ
jgi:hypothetical protein